MTKVLVTGGAGFIGSNFVRWALEHESVVHLDDLMLRRTRLGLLLPGGGEGILDAVRRIAAEVRGWTDQRWESETRRYREIITRYHTIPGLLPDG